jgi:hypothetical protein
LRLRLLRPGLLARLPGWLSPGLLPEVGRLPSRSTRGVKFLGRPVVLRVTAWRLMHVVHGTERAAAAWDAGEQILGAA